MKDGYAKGGFTLPGETGQEALTLELAEKWGADVIRDSDGTTLSDEILNSGYGIYSTICIIRDHNEWARQHPETLQQTFLMTQPVCSGSTELSIDLMKGFFEEQFRVNGSEESLRYWQVWDRTTGELVPREDWEYQGNEMVVIRRTKPWHAYTVSFFAFRIWEEISMYNHTTNDWGDKEHLMPIDPVHPSVQAYLLDWMERWCETHPATTVVRFTSMFYNFVWIWGSRAENRYLFTDWASYDFTVSPRMLDDFRRETGIELTAEDFINGGALHVTHMPPSDRQRRYMDFVNRFVVDYGKQLVDIVHRYGKKAYVFYDDSWVGVEPYGERFPQFGFDGLIKCVFSGYEVRLCAGASVPVHELRFHPYLFPVGLGGAPTFAPGGDPTRDGRAYWLHVRRAMLRVPIDRIGLGGYLHLLPDYPDFIEFIAQTADQSRRIRALHAEGAPYTLPLHIAVLHSWGSLRSWSLSGHFHETWMHDLIHINEALSGLPVDVRFISFDDVTSGAVDLKELDVIINAGAAGTAWSGGAAWQDTTLVERLTAWVAEGGAFIGVHEPSAVPTADGGQTFAMRQVLGVDADRMAYVCHGRYNMPVVQPRDTFDDPVFPEGMQLPYQRTAVRLTDGLASVHAAAEDGTPLITSYVFGKGCGVYLNTFETTPANNRLLLNLLLFATGRCVSQETLADDPMVEAAWFPASRTVVLVNNSDTARTAALTVEGTSLTVPLEPYELRFHEI
ncbi:MAG: 1,3-beta-galactosyl-N-acetylhexosamine phosphorylase [Butyrivibrio sp.]|nr:1,3-beta-galactosyl-N-acetylhexosamine phosphorylase [Butyrivibrio sp.]